MKTVGIFNDSFPPIMDGVALTAKNYAFWLHKKQQAVCVITPNIPDYKDIETFPVYRYSSIPIFGRKPYRLGVPEIDYSLKNIINKIQFGLVHAHCPFSSGITALRIARKQRVPLIATFHSKYRDDFEQSVHCKFITRLMVKKIIRFYEKADEVWIPQASVEETLREYGYKGKVEVVGNGNDFNLLWSVAPLKRQALIDLKVLNNEIVFLFVGQLVWEKNIRMIVESLAMLKDIPFRMFFVGTGYAADEIKQLVTEAGLSSKVEFPGLISDRETLKKYYAAADLFLFPSMYDTWAIVIHEAAAMQTPSVLANLSTISTSITDNVDGFLSDNNANAFAMRLRQLIADPELIRKTGLRASRSISRSWESVTDEVLDRYRHLKNRTRK
jgi:1,2-diacylglycerol 3-alpha-glucosyltransferase